MNEYNLKKGAELIGVKYQTLRRQIIREAHMAAIDPHIFDKIKRRYPNVFKCPCGCKKWRIRLET